MKADSTAQAFIFGALAAFFWGTHSVIVRYLTADIHGITIAALRLYIAAFVLFLIMKVYRQPVRIPFADRSFQVTTFGAVTNYILFHIGLEHTSASNAMVLENTAPFFVLLFLVLVLREKISKLEAAATLVAVFGVYVTVRHDFVVGGESWRGDILEILAGVTWAIFILGSSRALQETRSTIERIGFLFSVFIVSAALLTPLGLLYTNEITGKDALFLILLGVFPTAIAYWLWYEAAARVSTVPAALLFTLTIIFTFLNAHVFLGEELTANMIIGAALIVCAVVASKFAPSRER